MHDGCRFTKICDFVAKTAGSCFNPVHQCLYRQHLGSVFHSKFIRKDQKQRRNGEACQASLICFWSSLINLLSKDLGPVVQSILSLTSLLKGQLVKCYMALYPNTQIFL